VLPLCAPQVWRQLKERRVAQKRAAQAAFLLS
jgi:hypothetical protein